MDKNNELQKVILSIANYFEEQSEKENAELIMKLNEKFNESEELYESEMILSFLNFSKFASIPWLNKHPNVLNPRDKFFIEMIYNGTFSHFIMKTIEKNEGSACSGDKESFIIAKVKQSIVENKNISLYVDYKNCDFVPEEKRDAQAYWSPKSFKDTDEVKECFLKWYNVL